MLVRAANPIWWLPDLTGLSLNDEYYAFFLTNDLPYAPQAPYQDPNAISSWPYILEFQPSGTLPNNLYFDPTLVYRIEIRHGNTSADPLIWLIENFVPGGAGGGVTPVNTPFLDADNMITNPTFSDVYFSTPFTYTQATSGNYSIPIAPGWRIDLQGSGSITISQIPFSMPPVVGDPNYYLHIDTSAGATFNSIKLIQRFSNSPFIFENGSIAISFTAQAYTNPQTLTVSYQPSTGMGQTIYNLPVIALGGFLEYKNAVNLMAPTNSDSAPLGYVEIQFNIFPSAILDLTNIQVVGQTTPLISSPLPSAAPIYRQQTYERMVDHEFNVYRNSLVMQPKESLLAGWTFGLNPYQFIRKDLFPITTSLQTGYITDQTIIHTETVGAVAFSQANSQYNYGLQISAVNGINANRFAIIQYINATTMIPYWGQNLSSLVRALLIHTTGSLSAPQLKMRLIWRTTPIPALSAVEPITGWDTNGDVIFSSGWNAYPASVAPGISAITDPAYTLINSSSLLNTNQFPQMPYDQFSLPKATSSNTPLYLGIVVYINAPLNNVSGNVDSVIFDRISLVQNDFAIDAAVETFETSLRKCQAFYEKSYDVGQYPGAPTISSGGASTAYNPGFNPLYGNDRPFKVTKISVPLMRWYSPATGTQDFATIVAPAISDSQLVAASNPYVSTNSTGIPTLLTGLGAVYSVQWTANSVLGNPTLP